MKSSFSSGLQRIVAFFVTFLFSQSAFAQEYTVRDLGSLGGLQNQAAAINNNGQIAGFSTLANGTPRAFLYTLSTGTLQDLGVVGAFGNSQAVAINNSGQIVGLLSGAPSTSCGHAFVYDSLNGMQDIGALPGGTCSVANGINDLGVISGASNSATSSRLVPATFSGTEWTDLSFGSPTNDTILTGINNSGLMIGGAFTYTGPSFFSTGINNFQAIGNLPDRTGSRVLAVNSAGDAVGYSGNSPATARAMRVNHTNGALTDLGSLFDNGSFAFAINTAGTIVGVSLNASSNEVATLWSQGSAIDLNALLPAGSPWKLSTATGVNDTGQIVGWGLLGGIQRAFVLLPPPGVVDPLDPTDSFEPPIGPTDLCPADPLKTTPGTCGCGLTETDTNVNGVLDCFDIKSTTVPLKATVTFKYPKNAGPSAVIQMQEFPGVTYMMTYKERRQGAKAIKKNSSKSKFTIKNLGIGKKYTFSYQLKTKSGSPKITSKKSVTANFTVKKPPKKKATNKK